MDSLRQDQKNNLVTIIVTYPDKNKVYNMEIDVNSRVEELYKEFQNFLQIRSKFGLFHQEKKLDVNKTFAQQNVQKGDQILLKISQLGGGGDPGKQWKEQDIDQLDQITVIITNNVQRKINRITVNANNKVEELMRQLHDSGQIQQEASLIHSGQILHPNQTLAQQKVLNGSNLELRQQTVGAQ